MHSTASLCLRPNALWLVLLAASLLVIPKPAIQAADAAASALIRVMSFNVRYGTAADGENSWPQRRALLLDTIRAFDPDLLGTQEVLESQADFLKENLGGYEFHGVGREDGKTKGEYAPVMFRRARFEPMDAGHFWLSETPDQPGSKSWDSALPRMVSWVLLRDRLTQRTLVYANTHFDHRGEQARVESAKLILRKAAAAHADHPIILTGDFNVVEDSEPYRLMTKGVEGVDFRFLDSYRSVHPDRMPDEATFTGFSGRRQGSRIDFILHSPELIPLNAAIDRTHEGERYPSDHFPVETIFRWK